MERGADLAFFYILTSFISTQLSFSIAADPIQVYMNKDSAR